MWKRVAESKCTEVVRSTFHFYLLLDPRLLIEGSVLTHTDLHSRKVSMIFAAKKFLPHNEWLAKGHMTSA
jgi:hypothetical protein